MSSHALKCILQRNYLNMLCLTFFFFNFFLLKNIVAAKPQNHRKHLLHLEKGFAKYPHECLGIMNGF